MVLIERLNGTKEDWTKTGKDISDFEGTSEKGISECEGTLEESVSEGLTTLTRLLEETTFKEQGISI